MDASQRTYLERRHDLRVRRRRGAGEPRLGDPAAELLSIDLWECASTAAAHDPFVELLGSIQSDAIERRPDDAAIGDMAFALGDLMILFRRVNIVVFIRNAGPNIVGVDAIARTIDALLVRRSNG